MHIINTPFPNLLVIQPKVFEDSRGFFYEAFNNNNYRNITTNFQFLQDNFSMSHKGTLRGFHFQNPPYEQGKLVSVITGKVLDVVVDIRKNSPVFGKNFSIELSEKNKKQLWIPPGFAHGFLTLEDNTIFYYKCTNYYNKASESGIIWNDPQLNINWNIKKPILSEKDSHLPLFNEIKILFCY